MGRYQRYNGGSAEGGGFYRTGNSSVTGSGSRKDSDHHISMFDKLSINDDYSSYIQYQSKTTTNSNNNIQQQPRFTHRRADKKYGFTTEEQVHHISNKILKDENSTFGNVYKFNTIPQQQSLSQPYDEYAFYREHLGDESSETDPYSDSDTDSLTGNQDDVFNNSFDDDDNLNYLNNSTSSSSSDSDVSWKDDDN